MRPRWQLGDEVRVTRNVRDDGTYPGAARGDLLVRRGSIGCVRDVGSFLGDQIIYAVHFPATDRLVGCREEELIDLSEEWVPSLFETRERVAVLRGLAVAGTLRVPEGAPGEVLKVVRSEAGSVLYHVHFDCWPGHPLVVREETLQAA